MKIAVTGASGFIGRRLLEHLHGLGHQLHVLGRRLPPQAPPEARLYKWDILQEVPPGEALDDVELVVHLAGEPVAQRWTAEAKQRIRDSRVLGTRHLVAALRKLVKRPRALISASAVGYYGDRGEEILTEQSPPGSDFLAQTSVAWEQEASQARPLGMRVVVLRIGLVLGCGGGALEKMLPPFRLGLGGRIASGRQWMPWIHLDDVVGLIEFAAGAERLDGALNATAPKPVRNAEFTSALASALGRPALLPVPTLALKLIFGEMAELLTVSQRVQPAAALAAGYSFRFPELAGALENLLRT